MCLLRKEEVLWLRVEEVKSSKNEGSGEE